MQICGRCRSSMPTALTCPHCGHRYRNVYELIDDQPGTAAWLEERRADLMPGPDPVPRAGRLRRLGRR